MRLMEYFDALMLLKESEANIIIINRTVYRLFAILYDYINEHGDVDSHKVFLSLKDGWKFRNGYRLSTRVYFYKDDLDNELKKYLELTDYKDNPCWPDFRDEDTGSHDLCYD